MAASLEELFEAEMPAGLRCWGVLDGLVRGRILTDGAAEPGWAIVQEADYGTIYVGGDPSAEVLAQTIADLRLLGDVIIGLWPDDPLVEMLPTDYAYDGWAIDFTDRPPGEGLDVFLTGLPEGCELRRVDAALLERSVDREALLAGGVGAEAALENRVGYFLMKDDEILCEAISGPVIRNVIEMGVNTYELHRNRKYATLTCARLIQACEENGWETYWNCAKQNLASVALARKLGYRQAREYRVLAWFKSKG